MSNRKITQTDLDLEFKQNYLNLNHTVSISSYGDIFKIGDDVCHEGTEIEHETGKITHFSVDHLNSDVIAHTTKGFGAIDFMYHP